MYVCSTLANKQLIGIFVPEVERSIKHVINLEFKSITIIFISVEDLIMYVTYHLQVSLLF